MNREAWWGTVHGVTEELDMTYQLNNNNAATKTWSNQINKIKK